MNEWYYSDAGQQRGPVSFDELRQRAASSQLNPVSDLVWNSTMTSWQPAGQVPGIFDSTGAPPIPGSNPYAAPLSMDPSAPLAEGTLPMIPPGSQPPDVIACVSRAFTLTNRNFLRLVIIGVVYFIIALVLTSLIAWMTMPKAVNLSDPSSFQAYADSASQFSILRILLQFVQNIISIFLYLGLARVGLNVVSGGTISVAQLFSGGSKLLTAFGASILFGLAVFIGLILLIVPGIYLLIRLGYFLPAIVDRNLGAVDSLKYSWELTRNSALPIFLLWIVSALLIFAGALLLGIGLIYAMPVVSIATVAVYRWLQYGHVAVQDEPGTEIPVLRRIL
ncbi:MAG: DUF4339 domain-containing protein [Verrucomicrobiaceae bacterium]|nr:MAG: DUF4339 domain-containing protein [Verrucomicrobiaceae bacterium]